MCASSVLGACFRCVMLHSSVVTVERELTDMRMLSIIL